MDKPISPELSEYFSNLGKKGGQKLFQERGREYYQKIAAMRKKPGRKKEVK